MRKMLGPAALAAGLALAAAAAAQDGPPMPRPADLAPAEASADGLFGPDELDAMLGPVALFPDALLTQILVAATYPLDIVRAERWIAENGQLAADARAAAAEGQGWDPSVAVLAAGFPDVVRRMANDLDGTESLGDAVLAQTDDVLDSIQRLRGQAQASGALASTEEQTVSVDDGAISIAPTDPEVVYVPSYDPGVVYAAPPAGYATTPVYGDGYDYGGVLATGAIAFGGALLIDEIFDDDDDWHGYWGPDDVHIDWDDGDVYPRPDRDVDIEGDVNIDRDRIVVDRDRIDGDRLDPDRVDAARERIGARDPDRPRRDDAWSPDPERRAQAQEKLAARSGAERKGDALRAGGAAAAMAGGAAAGGGAARARLEAGAERRPAAGHAGGAFKPQGVGATKAKAARERGAISHQSGRKPEARQISKPKQARAPARKARRSASAVKKKPGGASRARASASRGKHSGGGRHGGGGRRR